MAIFVHSALEVFFFFFFMIGKQKLILKVPNKNCFTGGEGGGGVCLG